MTRWLVFAFMLLSVGCSKPVDEIAPVADGVSTELPSIEVGESDWPWWRGPQRNNIAAGPAPPLTWSPTENVLWKAPIPGDAHASPIVWGQQVFVVTSDAGSQTQSLLGLNRQTGEIAWEREHHQGGLMKKHSKNSHASATPATDGERVFATLINDGALWTSAVDFDGNIVWQEKSGEFQSQHGYGSSPVIWESLVIVLADNRQGGFLTAHHRVTGEIVWRVRRPNRPSYGTPIIAETGEQARLLVSGHNHVTSYDPLTGEQHWQAAGPADTIGNTMAWSSNFVFASGGYPESGFWALDAESGKPEWQLDFKQYVPSPVVKEDHVYVVQDGGVMRCLVAQTGKERWKKRLGGNFSASPVIWNDRIYVPNEAGKMFVVRAGDNFEKLAENELDGGGMASPVICGGQVFVRTKASLWCLAEAAAL